LHAVRKKQRQRNHQALAAVYTHGEEPMRLSLRLILPVVLFATSVVAAAQTTPADSDQQTFRTIAALDKQMFDAIDRCDMQTFATFWDDNVEFYHDKDGLMSGRENLVNAIKNNLCGKVKRELVPGTLDVHTLNNYGAVEIGVHRFLHPYQQDHGEVGEARFIHLWQLKDGKWKVTRVISYDHHGLGKQ
jgi:hypothetical protein